MRRSYAQKNGWATAVNIPGYTKTIGCRQVVLRAEDRRYVVDIDGHRREGLLPYKLAHGRGAQQVLRWLDQNIEKV